MHTRREGDSRAFKGENRIQERKETKIKMREGKVLVHPISG